MKINSPVILLLGPRPNNLQPAFTEPEKSFHDGHQFPTSLCVNRSTVMEKMADVHFPIMHAIRKRIDVLWRSYIKQKVIITLLW